MCNDKTFNYSYEQVSTIILVKSMFITNATVISQQ